VALVIGPNELGAGAPLPFSQSAALTIPTAAYLTTANSATGYSDEETRFTVYVTIILAATSPPKMTS
jgi:hypothetical protein